MKHEYHEGPKAGENFEKLARAVFKAPKVAVTKKQPNAKPTRRKTHGSDARTCLSSRSNTPNTGVLPTN